MKYEHDEPIAFAVVARDKIVDWSSADRVPEETLWLPEQLVEAARRLSQGGATAVLPKLNLNAQTRLSLSDLSQLRGELSALLSLASEPDLQDALGLILRLVENCSERGPAFQLLIEGP